MTLMWLLAAVGAVGGTLREEKGLGVPVSSRLKVGSEVLEPGDDMHGHVEGEEMQGISQQILQGEWTI